MDLGFVQTALADFSTFAKNLVELFQGIPDFFAGLTGRVAADKVPAADWTELANETKGLFDKKNA